MVRQQEAAASGIHSSQQVRIKEKATPLLLKKERLPLPFCLRPYEVKKKIENGPKSQKTQKGGRKCQK
jgi:hypothetical protein